MNRLSIHDRVRDMQSRDGTVIEIAEAAIRQVTVAMDEGGVETMAEGMLQKIPGWSAMTSAKQARSA